MSQNIIYTNHVGSELDKSINEQTYNNIFVLVDTNTVNEVYPRLQSQCNTLSNAEVITIIAGDDNKNLDSLHKIWSALSTGGATRHSLLINVGGGMVTDIGGFAASTFKRGIDFINIPTTLLSAVDAALGGKNGINFNGLKNEIGTFKEAGTVIISTLFFNTLPIQEIKSGYAEMIKHGIISCQSTFQSLINRNISDVSPDSLLDLIEESTKVKIKIVSTDPLEKGLRKALNFGHTVGHAFESLSIKRNSPIPHGYAVAYGMVIETILSSIISGFPINEMRKLAHYIYVNYGTVPFNCEDYNNLIDLMRHDKKNTTSDSINMTLLKNVGDIKLNCKIEPDVITAAFDIYREELLK